jgi:hypothetical protein
MSTSRQTHAVTGHHGAKIAETVPLPLPHPLWLQRTIRRDIGFFYNGQKSKAGEINNIKTLYSKHKNSGLLTGCEQ